MQYETGKAGDLLLWHSRLVHAAPPNHGTEPISLRPNVIYDFYKHPRPREGLIEDSPLDEIERGDPEVRNGRVFSRRGFLERKIMYLDRLGTNRREFGSRKAIVSHRTSGQVGPWACETPARPRPHPTVERTARARRGCDPAWRRGPGVLGLGGGAQRRLRAPEWNRQSPAPHP
jgi:hypothetical protein